MLLPRLPPGVAAINRATANAILRNENAILGRLRAVTAKATRTMAHATTVANALGSGTASLVILGSAHSAATQLRHDVFRTILDGRTEARAIAHRRMGAELEAARVDFSDSPVMAHASDARRAEVASDSYTRAWVATVTKAPPEGKPTASTVKAASGSQDFRLRRIAATENAQAYSEEHAAASRHVARAPGLFRRWEAILDKHVCKVCKSMDGQLAPVDGLFANGWEPGAVHPFCRCFSTLVGIPVRRDTGAGLVTRHRAMISTARPTAPPDKTPWGGGGDWGGGGSSGTF